MSGLAMTRRDAALVRPSSRVAGDQLAVVDLDLVGERLHLDTPAGGVGHAVVVAADADAMPSWETRSSLRTERDGTRGKGWSCGSSSAKASATTRPVVAWTRGLATVSASGAAGALRSSRFWNSGPGRSPRGCSGTAARPCPWSWPVGPAGPRVEAMVAGKIDQRPVVDDVALGILAADRGLHPVIEDLARHRRRAPRRQQDDSAARSAGPGAGRSGPRAGGCSRAPGGSQTIRVTPGSSANVTWNWAKSTCAWSPVGSRSGPRRGPLAVADRGAHR